MLGARFNPDNPAPPFTPTSHRRTPSEAARTPTPSRRSGSIHLASTVFAAPPISRGGLNMNSTVRAPHTVDGACETKQTAFEWPIRNVKELKAQLEEEFNRGRGNSPDEDDDDAKHEILAGDGAYFDDLAYKLHLERAPEELVSDDTQQQQQQQTPQEPGVILAVIALWAKYSDIPADEPFDRNVFVGIKQYEREGERALGEPGWLWTTSSVVTFSKRQEYWETVLPSLSTLLEDPGVAAKDAFSIRVVVKHGSEPGLPPLVHADQQFISRRITRMARGMLDSQRTGDVRFVCLEHQDSSTPSEAPDAGRKLARRRVVYAHSELLVHVDYFKAALAGGFAEGSEAGVRTLVVDDAAFNTVYWVLRWLYTDEILFSTGDSVRAIMGQVRVDRVAARRLLSLDKWDYAALDEDEDEFDLRTVRSTSSVGTAASAGRRSPSARTTASGMSPASVSAATSESGSRRTSTSAASGISGIPTSVTSTPRPGASRAQSSSPSTTIPRLATAAAAAQRSKAGLPLPKHKVTSSSTAPTSPPAVGRSPYSSSGAPRRAPPPPDPHKHPAEAPPPPSPLAVFFLAHRYGLEELQLVARDALLRQLTPNNCVAALLATFAFADLHAAVMDYVINNWADVSACPELDRCYQEVSAGVWGENDGGQVLLGLTRRLTGMPV